MGALMDYATEELNRLCDKNGDMDRIQKLHDKKRKEFDKNE